MVVGLSTCLRLYLRPPQAIQVGRSMSTRRIELCLLGCFAVALLSLGSWTGAGWAADEIQNPPPQTTQQQRPRKVGLTPTPSPTPPAEEVDEGDIVRVETQLVTVPAVVTDKSGR